MSDVQCEIDKCPAVICGGPHVAIETDIGVEILKEGMKPLGTPVGDMSAEERAAHEAAVEAAGGNPLREALNRPMSRKDERVERPKRKKAK